MKAFMNMGRVGRKAPEVGGQMPQGHRLAPGGRFRLSRWFGLVALAVTATIAIASVWLLNWFVTSRMLAQEGELTHEFVRSLIMVERPLQLFFHTPSAPPPNEVEESFRQVAQMPDVIRSNVYSRDRRVVWSSDPRLIGRQFDASEELDSALGGTVAVEEKSQTKQHDGKHDYGSLRGPGDLFIEIYVPVTDVATGRVIGAIELYKNPRKLTRTLKELHQYLTVGAVIFWLILFGSLFGLVRRADRIMQAQERTLVQNATFAALGEMSSAVAHGIRNPLASIRSSAELMLESSDAAAAGNARDIVKESDRLGTWLRDLLAYVRAPEDDPRPVALAPIVKTLLAEFSREFERRHIGTKANLDANLPSVRGDAISIGHVLRSLLSNALDAVPDGGRIQIDSEVAQGGRVVKLQLSDNGPGIGTTQRGRVGTPLFTTKPDGLGVGLVLARRVVERAGGELNIASEPGQGTVVTVAMRAV